MLLFLSWAFLHHPKNVRALFPYLYSQRHPLNFLCSVTVTTDFFLARLRPSPFFSRAKTSQCADWPGCFFPFNLRAEASGLAFFFSRLLRELRLWRRYRELHGSAQNPGAMSVTGQSAETMVESFFLGGTLFFPAKGSYFFLFHVKNCLFTS